MASTQPIDLTGYITPCPLRDEPLRAESSDVDAFAARVIERLSERDEMTAGRFGMGLLSPVEVARVAAEVHLEDLRS
jgi:hypothetical protein